MEQIKIQTYTEKKNVETLLNTIYSACRTEANLSPRPMTEIKNAYCENRLLFAVSGERVVGWLMRIPFNSSFQELAAGYVVEKYRSKGVFGKLLHAALPHTSSSVIVTFNYPFADYLFNKEGFQKSSLLEVVKMSRGRFLLNRLNFERIKAIRNHYQANSPIYAIYKSKRK